MFRPMRRIRQQLSDERCAQILNEQKRGVLALAGDSGYPYAVPLNFVCLDGKIYFHCAKVGHKIDAIVRCDKCSFTILSDGEKPDDDWAYYFDSVIVFGRIRIMDDREQIRTALTELGRKYFPTEEEVQSEVEKYLDRVAMLELTPEHISGKHVHER